jgi:hypothetical protein
MQRATGGGIFGHKFEKNSRLLLPAIHSPFYWRILQKMILSLLWLLKSIQKILDFVEWRTEGRKADKNFSLRRFEFLPRNLD